MTQYDVTLDNAYTYRVEARNVTGALMRAIVKAVLDKVVFNPATITDVTIKRVKS